MALIIGNSTGSIAYEDAEQLPNINNIKVSPGLLKNLFGNIFSECNHSLPKLFGRKYRLYPSLNTIIEKLNLKYDGLSFSPDTALTGPLCLTTLYYSASGQKKKICLILPDFSKTSKDSVQLLEELDPKIVRIARVNHFNNCCLSRLARKIVRFISTIYSSIFTFLKTPLTNAREKKEALLDRILENFYNIDSFCQNKEEWKEKCSRLRKELNKAFPMKKKKCWEFWKAHSDFSNIEQNVKDFRSGSLVDTPSIVAKYFLAAYWTKCEYSVREFPKNIKSVLKLPLSEEVRYRIYSIIYFNATTPYDIHLYAPCYKDMKNDTAKELEALKHCSAAKAMHEQIEKVIEALEGLLEDHINIIGRSSLDTFSQRESSEDASILMNHIGNYQEKIRYFFTRSPYEHALYKFFPETVIKIKLFNIYLFRLTPGLSWYDEGTKYNAAASEMKELTEKVKEIIPATFADYKGLLEILEHNTFELEQLKNHFKDSPINLLSSNIEITEI